jgi:hypothetical protein
VQEVVVEREEVVVEEEEERRGEEEERASVNKIVLTDFSPANSARSPSYCIRPGSFFGLIASASILRWWIYSN